MYSKQTNFPSKAKNENSPINFYVIRHLSVEWYTSMKTFSSSIWKHQHVKVAKRWWQVYGCLLSKITKNTKKTNQIFFFFSTNHNWNHIGPNTCGLLCCSSLKIQCNPISERYMQIESSEGKTNQRTMRHEIYLIKLLEYSISVF